MSTRKIYLAFIAALALSGAAAPAFAGGSYARVEQYGWGNGAGGGQHGYRNRMTIYQDGRGNSAISNQDGYRNRAVIGQRGSYNSADTYQRGARNIVGVGQFTKASGMSNLTSPTETDC